MQTGKWRDLPKLARRAWACARWPADSAYDASSVFGVIALAAFWEQYVGRLCPFALPL